MAKVRELEVEKRALIAEQASFARASEDPLVAVGRLRWAQIRFDGFRWELGAAVLSPPTEQA